MKLFKDIITDEELCSDAFKIDETTSEYFYIITGKNVKETSDIDESMIGGNKSQEEEDEGTEVVVSVVPNLVGSCNLQEVVTFTKPLEAKRSVMNYLSKIMKMDADEYNEKKRGYKIGDTTDYAAERDALFSKTTGLLRKLTEEEVAKETEKGHKFGKKLATTQMDVVLWDHFCGKDLFTKLRWYAGKEDEFDLNGQTIPLLQEGEEAGDKCSMLLWKHGVYCEGC